MRADVTEGRGAEHGVRDRVADRVRVRVAGEAFVEGDGDAAQDERAVVREDV
jgi:hypothetical protein